MGRKRQQIDDNEKSLENYELEVMNYEFSAVCRPERSRRAQRASTTLSLTEGAKL